MEWISVKDRLPVKDCNVLIYTDGLTINAVYQAGVFEVCRELSRLVHRTTHWMPIPEPPKK